MIPILRMSHFQGQAHLPFPPGPYTVGCVDLAKKNGVFLRLFYPHTKTTNEEEKINYLKSHHKSWPKWFPEPEYASAYIGFKYSRIVPTIVGKMFAWLAGNPVSPIIENCPISDDQPQFPLVIFSHGNGGCRNTYSILCSDIASRGFAVASVEHTDGSASLARTVNSEGTLDWVRPKHIIGEDYRIRNDQVRIRSQELVDTFKMMEEINEGSCDSDIITPFAHSNVDIKNFRGKFDLAEGAVLAGHSFGGATIVKALAEYEKFSSAFCFDAWMFPIKDEAEILNEKIVSAKKSVLFLNYEKFQWKNNLKGMKKFEKEIIPVKSSVTSNVITLEKAIHYVASDLPTIFSGSYLKYPMSVMDYFTRTPANDDRENANILLPEQGLVLSANLFISWIKSSSSSSPSMNDFDQCLQRYQTYLTWGISL